MINGTQDEEHRRHLNKDQGFMINGTQDENIGDI